MNFAEELKEASKDEKEREDKFCEQIKKDLKCQNSHSGKRRIYSLHSVMSEAYQCGALPEHERLQLNFALKYMRKLYNFLAAEGFELQFISSCGEPELEVRWE